MKIVKTDISQPNYGTDAPNVIRNLFITGITGLMLWFSVLLKFWSGKLIINPFSGLEIIFPLGSIGLLCALGFISMAFYMLWSSKVGKIRHREKLLDKISWTGNEVVLDVGCGRGLMLAGAAKRLTKGKVTGIDIWNKEDLSGNTINAVLENIRLENLEDKADVRTADMRMLPFDDESFDIILSRAAIHNLYSKEDREKAISEIIRVLKPGGQVLIDDIRHGNEYAAAFRKNGIRQIKRISSPVTDLILTLITIWSLRPSSILCTKPVSKR